MSLRKYVHDILEPGTRHNLLARWVDLSITGLILLNVTAVLLETVDVYRRAYGPFFEWFEIASVAVFTIEYLMRLWVSPEKEQYRQPILGRLRYAVSFMALIDLFAILPFFLPFVMVLDLRVLRALRLFRVFRLLKSVRYSEALIRFAAVFDRKREELVLVLVGLIVLTVIASSLLYFAEHERQPEVFSSIPATLWCGLATLTTVGYGDMKPVTGFGKILSSILMIIGVGFFALPAGLIASGYAEVSQNRAASKTKGPSPSDDH